VVEAEPMFGISQASLSPSIANHTGEATQLAEFLSVHYRENTSAADLAALFHLSESQMRRKFVKAYGRPPIAYRNSLRCKIADELLLHTNLSISEIAERIGYSTPADFYRSFLKIHGVTPSDRRRNHKKA
jgi:AraC-like DNA-binding protein